MTMNWHIPLTILAFAEADVSAVEPAGAALLLQHLFAAMIFSIMGLLAFGVGLWAFNRFAPFSVRKELEEDQNTAVAMIIGAMILGIAIIIASAIHG